MLYVSGCKLSKTILYCYCIVWILLIYYIFISKQEKKKLSRIFFKKRKHYYSKSYEIKASNHHVNKESQIFDSKINKAKCVKKCTTLFPSLGTKWELKSQPKQLILILSIILLSLLKSDTIELLVNSYYSWIVHTYSK